MKNTKLLLLCLMLTLTCLMVFTLVGCDTLLGGGEHKHNFVQNEAKEPTCTEEGWLMYYTCSECEEYTTFKSVPALGHDIPKGYEQDADSHSRGCTRCSYVEDEPHNWQKGELTVTPTCEADGTQTYSCGTCGREKTETVKAFGHNYPDKYVFSGDVHTLSCTHCSKKIEEAHVWTVSETVEPTCTENGVRKYVCNVCEGTKSDVLVSEGHSFSKNYKPNGDVHSRVCSGCDETIDAPHEWVKFSIEKEPNCVETGIQVYACSGCGGQKREELPVVDEHFDGDWKITKSPTATIDGLKVLHCVRCNKVIDEEILPCDAKSMPIIYLEGNYMAATAKKNEVEMSFTYVDPNRDDFEGYATIKVQGASSTAYAKKNYTIKFYKAADFDKKLKVDLGWGKESKYVMKANWVDFIQARNVVSCRIWGDMVKTRNASAIQERLASLPTNGGAIDGYPIAVYMNGEFHGIYTMNVPKDEWMFGMDDSETEALICADDWNHTNFSSLIGYFKEDAAGDLITDGWELKYCGSDDTKWVTDSFNALIKFCWNNEGEAFKAGISQHLDVDAAIDYLIYMYVNYMRDNTSKNMIWATYDGKVWIPSVYDQDGVFGQVWDGKRYAPASDALPTVKSNGHIEVGHNLGPDNDHLYNGVRFILWDRIWNAYTEEILIRYKQLRETILTEQNIIAEFEAFRACIPESVYQAEIDRWAADRASWWSGQSGTYYERFNYEYTYQWIGDRLDYVDEAMRNIYNKAYLPTVTTPAPELQ